MRDEAVQNDTAAMCLLNPQVSLLDRHPVTLEKGGHGEVLQGFLQALIKLVKIENGF